MDKNTEDAAATSPAQQPQSTRLLPAIAKSRVMFDVLKFLPKDQHLQLQKVCNRWYDDLLPTFYARMNAVCYKTIIVGPPELMAESFEENYDPVRKSANENGVGSNSQIDSAMTKVDEMEDKDEIYWEDHIKIKDSQVIPFSSQITQMKFQPGLQGIWLELKYSSGHDIELYDAPEELFNITPFEVWKFDSEQKISKINFRCMDSPTAEHTSALEGIVVTLNDGKVLNNYHKDLSNNNADTIQYYELDLKQGKIVGCEIVKKHSQQVNQIKYGLKFNIAWLETTPKGEDEPTLIPCSNDDDDGGLFK